MCSSVAHVVSMDSCLGHKDLLCDVDIPMEMFANVRVDAILKDKFVEPCMVRIQKDFPLTAMPSHYLIVQHKFVERLNFAMDQLPRKLNVKLKVVADFSLLSVITSNEASAACAIT